MAGLFSFIRKQSPITLFLMLKNATLTLKKERICYDTGKHLT